MGRNDFCFCGSGKKQKRCHSDIYEGSIVADLIIKYSKIDNCIENKRRTHNISTLCKKGCSECCSTNFSISEIEYYSIMNYILKEKEDSYILNVIKKSKDLMQELHERYNDIYSFLTHYTTISRYNDETVIAKDGEYSLSSPCVFLNNDTHECSIYKVRPLICRLYGTTLQFDRCEKYITIHDNNHYLTDISDITNDISNNVDYLDTSFGKVVLRPYPIMYWVANRNPFEEKYKQDYILATGHSINDYISKKINRSMK